MRLTSLQDAPYAFSSTYDSQLHRSAESWREQAESTAQGTNRATFIAFSEDVPIGIAALYRIEVQADVGELVQVWITPEYRGKSIAWDLMNTILEWAGENNFHTIKATITDGNTRALKFYIKYGFSITGESSSPNSADVILVKEI
jgi:RimJ/RimL family protein N-acetyltransferase